MLVLFLGLARKCKSLSCSDFASGKKTLILFLAWTKVAANGLAHD
jgi:hypothetical protein